MFERTEKHKRGEHMKGKNPTRRQKEILAKRRLNPDNWLICKNLIHQGELHVVHRYSNRERIIRLS